MAKYLFSNNRYFIIATDSKSGKEVWRRSIRTYLRDHQPLPLILIFEKGNMVLASWEDGKIALLADNGKVVRYERPLSA